MRERFRPEPLPMRKKRFNYLPSMRQLDGSPGEYFLEGFPCPKCLAGGALVNSSKYNKELLSRTRARQCRDCGYRFSTTEWLILRPQRLSVLKRDRTHQAFSREKLRRSMQIALAKRNIPRERLERIVDSIHNQASPNRADGRPKEGSHTVSSSRLGALVLATLKELDEVAYVRYASVFGRFRDKSDFTTLINRLETPHGDGQ